MKLDTDVDHADYYFPVNLPLAQNILGKFLTHIEALGLPDKVEKANKDLVRQSFWRWWDNVQENSMTSYRGCIAPIQVLREDNGRDRKYVWLNEPQTVAVSVNR